MLLFYDCKISSIFSFHQSLYSNTSQIGRILLRFVSPLWQPQLLQYQGVNAAQVQKSCDTRTFKREGEKD